jgi:IS5 family transposase
MIDARRLQRTFGDGFVAETVADLQDAWMRHADAILHDDALVSAVYAALGARHPQSRTRGRRGALAEMVLRLLVLKSLRNWRDATLEREVRANLVYRDFTRSGGGKVPDAKTMGRWGVAVGPAVIEDLPDRLNAIAQQPHVVEGRTMRVDTTVVETHLHDEADRRDCWDRRGHAARPPPPRHTSAVGNRPDCSQPDGATPREVDTRV